MAPTSPIGFSQFACDHECLPHQGLGNVLLPHPLGAPPEDEGEAIPFDPREIKCQSRLGEPLNRYSRDAA